MTFAAGVWWITQTSDRYQRAKAVSDVESLGDHLSASIEPLLASGELSSVRRLLVEAGQEHGLSECRLLLSDGRPLVDQDLDKPQLTVMPVTWPESEASNAQTRVINDRIVVERPVPVISKGEATLSVVAQMPTTNAMIQAALPGVALIGMGGMAFGLLLMKKLRQRLAVLTLIREAMVRAGHDNADLSSLAIDPKWGDEAAGWNRLLANDQIKQTTATHHELEQLNAGGGGGILEDACEVLGDGLLLTDSRGRVVYLNGAASAALFLDSDSAIGMPLLPMLANDALTESIDRVLSGKGPGRDVVELSDSTEAPDNTLRVTVRRLNQSGGVVVTTEDITQQRMAQAAQHDFINRATHELRTPLTNIRMYVETAQTDGEDDTELRGECLNVISRESQRLERLVSEMLSVSEIEAGSLTIQRDDVRLDQLFKSLEQDYVASAAQKQIDLRFDLPPKLPAIQGDRDRLAIVLQNLLGNAIKYTPEGGEVSVSVDLSATELAIDVRDSGIGIAEQDQARVFEKFYRANDPRLGEITGSGLGLALAFEIVRLHGGELTVESELNQGSTFRVSLPVTAEGM